MYSHRCDFFEKFSSSVPVKDLAESRFQADRKLVPIDRSIVETRHRLRQPPVVRDTFEVVANRSHHVVIECGLITFSSQVLEQEVG